MGSPCCGFIDSFLLLHDEAVALIKLQTNLVHGHDVDVEAVHSCGTTAHVGHVGAIWAR
jgi:hypothetical protein